MTTRKLILVGALAAVPVACLSTVAGCSSTGPCGWIAYWGDPMLPAAYVPPLLVGLTSALGWMLIFVFRAARATRGVARLERVASSPPTLVRAAGAARIKRIACLRGGPPVAFCSGLFRPTVFISEDAVNALSIKELIAVLRHEADHAIRREPLRRVARAAAADVLIFIPLVRWWAHRQAARSELRADTESEQLVGKAALAGALLVMTDPEVAMAAFAGHTELRARRLLGMRVDESGPPRALFAATLAYSLLALSLAGCFAEVVLAVSSRSL